MTQEMELEILKAIIIACDIPVETLKENREWLIQQTEKAGKHDLSEFMNLLIDHVTDTRGIRHKKASV